MSRWMYQGKNELTYAQFFLSDTRILVKGTVLCTLDAQTGKRLSEEGGTNRPATSPVISPDGTWLTYTNGQILLDRFPRTTPLPKGQKNLYIRDNLSADSTYFFSSDGQTFVVNTLVYEGRGRRSRVDFYDVKTWKRTRFWWTDVAIEDNLVRGPSHLSRNGRFLLCASYVYSSKLKSEQARVSLWRVNDGQKLGSQTIPGIRTPSAVGPLVSLPSFEVQNDGRVLKFGAHSPVYLSKTSNLNADFEQLLSLPTETITTATISPNGSYLIVGTASGRVYSQRVK